MTDTARAASQPSGLSPSLRALLYRATNPLTRGPLDRILGLRQIDQLYADIMVEPGERNVFDRIMDALEVRCQIEPEDLARVPTSGPVIVVANHPFGAIEGVILASLLLSIRTDVKILANHMLSRIPELRQNLIFVDPFEEGGSVCTNIRGIRESIHWLEQGGLLGVFPAGEVAHFQINRRSITDPQWKETVAHLTRKTNASVLPLYFSGSNGFLFQLAGMTHWRLRTALLPHEFLNKRNRTVEARVGSSISPHRLVAFANDKEMTGYLRRRTYHL